ncbi:thioredoxin family protein [Amphritea opalescens]|uniref:Thioredoxin family protein n=1 Tax=Amphritea opalescens TaxID=2490544 RepID=A0A430KUY7_9GAMM|nr:thioredoxin family protein [Amphritea opalescens]RTE67286.1 thioredoxin family protein [Amphritea opalescens]
MKQIKVLGSGCSKCKKTAELIEQLAHEMGIPANVTKETDPQVMMAFGVMSTPAVAIDDQLVHSGSVPNAAQVKEWLTKG